MTLVLRSEKGSALSYQEMDANFQHAVSNFSADPWSITLDSANNLTFSYSNDAKDYINANGHIIVVSVAGQSFVSQDSTVAPFFANTAALTGSSYAPTVKVKANGAAVTRTLSFGALHNADNTIDGVVHGIDSDDTDNRTWLFKQNGDFVSSGNVTAYSDIRLKENIEAITNALEKVKALRGVTFDMNGKRNIGVIAQELRLVVPEAVNDGEYLSVAYGNLVALLIEAIKDLSTEVEELKRGK